MSTFSLAEDITHAQYKCEYKANRAIGSLCSDSSDVGRAANEDEASLLSSAGTLTNTAHTKAAGLQQLTLPHRLYRHCAAIVAAGNSDNNSGF